MTLRLAEHLLTLGQGHLFLNATLSRGDCVTSSKNVLIEARVELATGRLASVEWLQPTAKRGGLRNAAC